MHRSLKTNKAYFGFNLMKKIAVVMMFLALLSSGFIGFFGVYVNLDTTALGKSHNIDDKESSTRNSENVYSRQGMTNNRISERASFSGT